MERQKIKPRRASCILSRQLIIQLLEKYESSKVQISLVQFCKDNDLPVDTFYTWLRYQREVIYKANCRFITLSPESVSVAEPSVSLTVFANIKSWELIVQPHQYVAPEYIQSLLDKPRGLRWWLVKIILYTPIVSMAAKFLTGLQGLFVANYVSEYGKLGMEFTTFPHFKQKTIKFEILTYIWVANNGESAVIICKKGYICDEILVKKRMFYDTDSLITIWAAQLPIICSNVIVRK